jgi:hypothetical protein
MPGKTRLRASSIPAKIFLKARECVREAIMTTALDQNNPAAEADEQLGFIGRFQELFARDAAAGLTLINIYQELPITHPASITEIRGRHLELTTSELQLAAILHCNEVYIRSPHFELPILGKMDSIDIQRGLVRLSNFCFAELQAENRETVRVRFKRPTNIIIHSGSNRISGVIHDISLGGCCVNTLVRKGLEDSDETEVELKVIDKTTGLPNCTRIPSSIVQICGDSSPFKCIFSFRHTSQSERFLSVLINQRQLEIVKELRDSL